MRLCSGKPRLPSSHLALCYPYGQGGSWLPLSPWALLLAWWSAELETNSKRVLLWGEGGFGMKRPCLHRAQQPTLNQLGRNPPSGGRSNGPKLASGSFILRTSTVLGNQPQPQCVFAQESKACVVLTWPYVPHRAKDCLACLWLRGQCCLAGGLRGLKPIPNVFFFGKKAGFA